MGAAFNRGAQPLGDLLSFSLFRLHRNDDELFTAPSYQDVQVPHLLLNGFGNQAENAIAGEMAVPVVDLLKMVQVEHDDG